MSSEGDLMDYENIDERLLPVLTDNCDETSISQSTIELRVESLAVFNQCKEVIEQEHTHNVSIANPATQSIVVMSPLVLLTTAPRSESETNPYPSTLNGPPGLLIGEKINVEESKIGLPLPQSDVSTNDVVNQHEFSLVSAPSNLYQSFVNHGLGGTHPTVVRRR